MRQFALRRRVDPRPANHEPLLDEAPRLLPGLSRLAELLLTSRAHGEDVWRRAARLCDLSHLGLTPAELRPLILSGLVAPKPSQLGPKTRLVLTDAGLAYVTRQFRLLALPCGSTAGLAGGGDLSAAASRHTPAAGRILPHYDIDARELNVAGVLILRLPVQARNLAAVLTALQLSGWNRRVAKPLNGSPGGNDHHHLANVALRLNRHQEMIDFRTDDGAICWTWRSPGA